MSARIGADFPYYRFCFLFTNNY